MAAPSATHLKFVFIFDPLQIEKESLKPTILKSLLTFKFIEEEKYQSGDDGMCPTIQ